MWLKTKVFCQGHQVVSISKGFDTHFRYIKIVRFSWEVLIRSGSFFVDVVVIKVKDSEKVSDVIP